MLHKWWVWEKFVFVVGPGWCVSQRGSIHVSVLGKLRVFRFSVCNLVKQKAKEVAMEIEFYLKFSVKPKTKKITVQCDTEQ